MEFLYRLKTVSERLGDESLEVDCLAHPEEDFEKVIAVVERELDPELDERARIDLLMARSQELRPWFGTVWPSARALGNFVATLDFSDKTVLEVGCGLALPSMVAARRGGVVTATDRHPDVLHLLESNLQRNGLEGRVQFAELDWLEPADTRAPSDVRYDWVIGSDVLYERHLPAALAKSIARLVRPGGKVVIADPARPYLHPFVQAMGELGFDVESIRDRVIGLSPEPSSTPELVEILVVIFTSPG